MTLFVRNEEDILEANLRYHLERGVDFIIATENRSEDATPEILAEHARAGHLHLIRHAQDDYAQPQAMTRMARLAAEKFGADWVINNDADEFWWPREGSLRDAFSSVPPGYGAFAAYRWNFAPRPEDGSSFLLRMDVVEVPDVEQLRDRKLRRASGARHFMVPKVAHRAASDVEITDASHGVAGTGLDFAHGWQPVEILHYPLRSYAQFEAKVRNGGRALERHPDPDFNRHLRRLYELYREGGLPDHYFAQVLDDAAVDSGIEDGRLLRDRRLRAFLNREDEESVDGTEPRARAARAIAIGEYEKWVAEKRLSGLTRRLEKRERRLEEVRSRLERERARKRK